MKAEKQASRAVTIEKLERDAENIRQYARFVIIIDGEEIRIVDNAKRFSEKSPLARLIVVLGPVKHKGVLLSETVLLEIGYSRTRPYAQLESRLHKSKQGKGTRWFLKPRSRARKISDEELIRVSPIIEACMTQVVLECREIWHNKDAWFVKNNTRAFERGIYFTFSKQDRSLYRHILREDIRFRKERYILWHAQCVRFWLGHYRNASYSAKQLRNFSGVVKVVELVDRYKEPAYRRALLECFKPGTKFHTLLDRIGEVFHLKLDSDDPHTRFVFEAATVTLPFFEHIRCCAVKQPEIHAKECFVVEGILERSYREKNEIPF